MAIRSALAVNRQLVRILQGDEHAVLLTQVLRVPGTMQFFLMSDHLHLSVHGGAVVGAVVMLTILTGVAALYPSFRAARLRPVEAMSHFG